MTIITVPITTKRYIILKKKAILNIQIYALENVIILK